MTNIYLILATQRARTKKRRIRNKSTSPAAAPGALETPTDDDRDPVKTDETAEVESETWPYAKCRHSNSQHTVRLTHFARPAAILRARWPFGRP